MQQSVAIVLDAQGRGGLDVAALGALDDMRIVRAEVVRGERAVCVALTVEHVEPVEAVGRRLRSWGRSRGWAVTIAPLGGSG